MPLTANLDPKLIKLFNIPGKSINSQNILVEMAKIALLFLLCSQGAAEI